VNGAAGVGIFLGDFSLACCLNGLVAGDFIIGAGPSKRVFFPTGLPGLPGLLAEARAEVVFLEFFDVEGFGAATVVVAGAEVALRFAILGFRTNVVDVLKEEEKLEIF
jgi:hypothetical protein